ncbi:MAG: hypothetical protein KJO31_04230 [Gammaproteobacteria bacterium]|nr:hypothetical protein [Gammaproteobacteria bacterium]
MAYLLAKFSLLFLITALLGFVLGYWWSRRNFVDVSESYEDLRTANHRSDQANWTRLWKRLDLLPAPKEPDFSTVNRRIDEIDTAISKLPRVEPASINGIKQQLSDLLGLVRQLPVPVDTPQSEIAPLHDELVTLRHSVKELADRDRPAEVDMSPLAGRIEKLEDAVRKSPAPQRVELGPVVQQLDALKTAFRARPAAKEIDLQPVLRRLNAIESEVRGRSEPLDIDLDPVVKRLDAIESGFRALPVPQDVDLEPVVHRLDSIETEVRGLKAGHQADFSAERPGRARDRSEPVILSAALYGHKDDLKKISGVGPKLERLLNKNGVFYFWQVASWKGSDIDIMDERLDSFKGRISRDDWVTQATSLSSAPDAAPMPDERELR